MPIDDVALLTPAEAAKILGVQPQTLALWRCARSSPLPWVRVGRLVRYRRGDVQAYIAARRVVPEPPTAERTVRVVEVRDMLRALRDPRMEVRFGGMVALARSLGIGLALAGEHELDVKNLIAPQFGALVARAVLGESAAADELERAITDTPPAPTGTPEATKREAIS